MPIATSGAGEANLIIRVKVEHVFAQKSRFGLFTRTTGPGQGETHVGEIQPAASNA